MNNKPKKFIAIAKVEELGITKFVKYRFNFIDNFISWLNSRYKVFYINIYSNTGETKRQKVGSWGSRKGLELN